VSPSLSRSALRARVLQALPVLVLAVVAGALWSHYHELAALKQKAFESLFREAQQGAKIQLKCLFEPVIINLFIGGRWVQGQAPDLGDASALNAQFMPILQEVTQISAARVADGAGREYMLVRTDQGWLTRLTDPQGWAQRARWTRWAGPGEALESWQDTLDYDPRTRPWFRGAVDSGPQSTAFWTSPYRSFTTKEPGVTVASRWPQPSQQGGFRVLAFDLRLSAISTLTQGLAPGDHVQAFVLSREGRIIGLRGDAQLRSPASIAASFLPPAEAFPEVTVRDAYSAWLVRGDPRLRPLDSRPGTPAPHTFPTSAAGWSPWGTKKVLMILCHAAPKPVFLKHDKGEDFAIRTGSASRSLAPSEVFAYVATRRRAS
jgi:hypothetical protein